MVSCVECSKMFEYMPGGGKGEKELGRAKSVVIVILGLGWWLRWVEWV